MSVPQQSSKHSSNFTEAWCWRSDWHSWGTGTDNCEWFSSWWWSANDGAWSPSLWESSASKTDWAESTSWRVTPSCYHESLQKSGFVAMKDKDRSKSVRIWGSVDSTLQARGARNRTDEDTAFQEVAGLVCRMPTEEERSFVTENNKIATAVKSPGFGDTDVAMNSNLARGSIQFAHRASVRWPDLGEPLTMPMRGAPGTLMVDPSCTFWMDGHERYVRALRSYVNFLNASDAGCTLNLRCELLKDLGFHLIEDFVTQTEESELLAYWAPTGQEHAKSSCEQGSKRRFFHYGPALQQQTQNSSKSTLAVVPCLLGAMPEIVERMQLKERIRDKATGLGDRVLGFEQLYVNWYSRLTRSRIDFHHDNPKSMGAVIAGISLGGHCEMQLLALDEELKSCPIVVPLQPRSLYLMSGLSRYHFQHGIPPVRENRLSLTFRNLDKGSSDRALWRREWTAVPVAEARNTNWPLLPPKPVQAQ